MCVIFISQRQSRSFFDWSAIFIFEHHQGMYLFIRSTTYWDILGLAVERIDNIEITPDHFESPAVFSPETYLKNAFELTFEDPVEVTLRITTDRSNYLTERVYFQKQRITKEPDGSIMLTLTTSGRKDIKR
jgi:exopolysaccharide biosynthesis predicted pyruvyltransferase EpsI